jgi:tetratricopeptide (TPR) repeat protein
MQDPQPRERDYVFVGAFATFAVWMGMGAADLVGAAGRGRWARAVAAVALLLIPVGAAASGFRAHDRTGDSIAHDYAYNILQTCDRDAVLFTNGDNDTFPLWYLQEVEGVRRDVRVVNLSLLNTSWYIRQLRDFPPRLPIPLSDAEVEALCANTADAIERTGRYWPEARAVSAGGIMWTIPKNPYLYLRTQEVMVWKLIGWADRKRPVYFAVTVPAENTVGLEPFLVTEGMAVRVGDREGVGVDADRAWRNLREVYRLRGVNAPGVYREPDTVSLLSNYPSIYLQVAEAYGERGEGEKAAEVLRRCEAEVAQPGDWKVFLLMGRTAARAGQRVEAVRLLEKCRSFSDPADPSQRLPLADVMIEAGAFDRAVSLYREVLAQTRMAEGASPEERSRVVQAATYNLAVALDRKGETQEAIATLEGLARMNPGDPTVQKALEYLREKGK